MLSNMLIVDLNNWRHFIDSRARMGHVTRNITSLNDTARTLRAKLIIPFRDRFIIWLHECFIHDWLSRRRRNFENAILANSYPSRERRVVFHVVSESCQINFVRCYANCPDPGDVLVLIIEATLRYGVSSRSSNLEICFLSLAFSISSSTGASVSESFLLPRSYIFSFIWRGAWDV